MEFYLHFNLTMDRSPGFGSCTTYFMRPFQTRFRYGCRPEVLNLARDTHSPDHSTKGTRSHVDVLSVLVNTRFQVLFHSPPGVLFGACKHKVSGSLSLPSRGAFHLSLTVLFSIGHQVVFRLGGWSPRIPTGFHVSGGTLDTASSARLSSTGLSPSMVCFPTHFD